MKTIVNFWKEFT